jgi:ABC-type branched-subunit amino acid transport system ATPase component/ABC-type branched-subunit amino acid transport system permease subunit
MFLEDARRQYLALAGFAAAYLVVIALTYNSYYQLMLTLVPIWAVMGLSWNVLSGYSGLVSFGQAVFFGLGAYTVTLLFKEAGITPWIGIPIAAMAGSLAGIIIGLITFRLTGHYFALAMLAYPLAMLHVFQWAGFQEVSLPFQRENPIAYMQFADQRWYAVIALVLMILAMLVSIAIERSRFGLSLLSIKQNELAAEAAGINSVAWKLRAIAVSGGMAGGIGGLYAVVLLVVTPDTVFGLHASAQALVVTMFGGVGTVWGPVIGAAVLIPLAETLHAELASKLPGIQGVVYGIAIILVIVKMPHGIVWAVRDRWRKAAPVAAPVAAPSRPVAAAAAPAPPDEVILRIKGLSRSFGGVKALNNIDIDVKGGEILGIIGPNGAGKTTLFNVLNGMFPPTAGTRMFAEHDLAGLRPSGVCALGIGRTFQVVRPFPRMTLLENVVVGAFVRTPNRTEALAIARDVIGRVGLGGFEQRAAGELTNYQLRLMELARALSGKPSLLLLDEPFAGLASTEIEKFLDLIRDIRASGTTIVIIEHTMQAMVKLVDRFVVLDHGVVIAQGNPQDVIKDRAVIRAYLGENWA